MDLRRKKKRRQRGMNNTGPEELTVAHDKAVDGEKRDRLLFTLAGSAV